VWYGEHKTKEEWLQLFQQHYTSSQVKNDIQSYKEMLHTMYQKNMYLSNTENCIGDYLASSKNLQHCFDVVESENCKYTTYVAF
jgi:hypothetical protein